MSIVADNILRREAVIDRIARLPLGRFEFNVAGEESEEDRENAYRDLSSPRINRLLKIVKSLSSNSSSQPLLQSDKICGLLEESGLLASAPSDTTSIPSSESQDGDGDDSEDNYGLSAPPSRQRQSPSSPSSAPTTLEHELEWVLVTKATAQAYGVMMNTFLGEIIPLNTDIWYWEEVLSSYTNSSIYAVQLAPQRLLEWSWDVWRIVRESRTRLGDMQMPDVSLSGNGTVTEQWRRFWGLVRRSVARKNVQSIQARILSPVARCRADARHSAKRLRRMQDKVASGLGILIDEGLSFDVGGDSSPDFESAGAGQKWKGVVERSVSLLDHVINDAMHFDYSIPEYEDAVFAAVQDDPMLGTTTTGVKPAQIAARLHQLLKVGIPSHLARSRASYAANLRPSRLTRYWLPLTLAVLSSSTVLRILLRRRAAITAWIADFGATVRDFWFNWIVEPVTKVIKTIRHDESSEIALMSRDSLKADRESLERMVVQFATDKPQYAALTGSSAGGNVTEAQLNEIRARVREGDVTPVLRAFEADLRRPFVGAVAGDLVRSLLIQVQKTKVDLEVAIGGIDALLRSQELVFGFVGLTPGVLVVIGAAQWLRGVIGGSSRREKAKGTRASRIVRTLRNVDRVFYEAAVDPDGLNENGEGGVILGYKHRGLLVCEVHVLRTLVKGVMPGSVERDFLVDLDDVVNAKPMERQREALNRVRWAYARWFR